MTVFQIVVLGVLAVLASLSVSAGVRGTARKRIVAMWLLVWGGGAIALVWPHTLVRLAHFLGIGRGADLLLYVSVMVTFTGFFYVYTRFRKMDRQLTVLVRQLAVRNAEAPLADSEPRPQR